MRISLLGETVAEAANRTKDLEYANRDYISISVDKGKAVVREAIVNNMGGTTTPGSNIQLKIGAEASNWVENVRAEKTQTALSKIPGTPVEVAGKIVNPDPIKLKKAMLAMQDLQDEATSASKEWESASNGGSLDSVGGGSGAHSPARSLEGSESLAQAAVPLGRS